MMRRIRLRESIQGGMTSCRRDKLGLGLSLLYHLVGAQGSDLRYEIVSESQPSTTTSAATASPLSTSGGGRGRTPLRVVLPSMTKFWFLLPMSLDFPDRLPAEHIVKDDICGGCPGNNNTLRRPSSLNQIMPTLLSNSSSNNSSNNRSATAATSLLQTTFPMVPDGSNNVGMGMQQPPQKRAKLSSLPQQQKQQSAAAAVPVPEVNPLNSILSANVMGTIDNTTAMSTAVVASSSASPAAVTATVAASKTAASSKPQYPGVAPGARPLVLVVEDTDVSASLLCMHLRKLNCTSHRAENGEVALEMLRSAPAPNMYSLILMDLRMPVMDGFEATRIIKSSNASNIPVVALTGETSEENRKRCDEIGFDDYKTKPLKRPQLKELLNTLVPGYIASS